MGRQRLYTPSYCTLSLILIKLSRWLIAPLAQVAILSLENLIRQFIEKAPHVLFYEDIAGKAPYDIIVENQLHGYLECLMPSYTQSRRFPSNHLLHWPLFAFDSAYKGALQEKQPYRVWEVCQEIIKSMKPGLHYRKLLTNADRVEISQLYVQPFDISVCGMTDIYIDQKTRKYRKSQKEMHTM